MATATKKRKTPAQYVRERAAAAAAGNAVSYTPLGDGEVPDDFQQTLTNGVHSPASTAVINRALRGKPDRNGDTELPIERPVVGALVQTISIPLVNLIPSPYQVVSSPAEDWLVESLKTEGQLVPCRVRQPNPEGKYELIAGHRRHAAAIKVGMATLRCDVIECDDLTAARQVHRDNADRHELSALDKAAGLQMLVDQYEAAGQSQRQLAADLGISQGHVSNSIRLLRIPAMLQARLRVGDYSIEHGRTIAKYADRKNVMDHLHEHLQRWYPRGPVPSGQLDTYIRQAVNGNSRSMADCHFNPTEEELQQLDVEEVKYPSGATQRRAFNVQMYNKLEKAAVAEQKEASKTAAAISKTTPPDQANRLKCAVADSWDWALGHAIAAHVHGKRTKAEKERVARLALYGYMQLELSDDSLQPALLLELSPAEFIDHAFKAVQVMFNEDGAVDLDGDYLEQIAQALAIDPDPYWQPSAPLLDSCTDRQLQGFATDCGVGPLVLARKDLIPQLLGRWPGVGKKGAKGPGPWIPDLFRMQKPTKQKRGRRKAS